MRLTDLDIDEFRSLYERKHGIHLPKQEAHAKACALVRLIEASLSARNRR